MGALLVSGCGASEATSSSTSSSTSGGAGGALATGSSSNATSTVASSGGSGTGGAGGSLDAAKSALDAAGLAIAIGDYEPADLNACCSVGKNCAGNNPSSPYLLFRVPEGPGQTATNPSEDASGASVAWRLREDEAIVYIGRTPPSAKYFGFTPYLFDRQNGNTRAEIFASLSETTNNQTIGVDPTGGQGVFDKPVIVIVTADGGTDALVRQALASAGYPASSMNTLEVDPSVGHFGLDGPADTFGMLFRVALFDDPTAGSAYVNSPPGAVWRVTPKTQGAPEPLPPPAARTKNTANDEASLATSVDALRAAIIAAHPGLVAEDLTISDGAADPAGCIQNLTSCFGDNRDTIYPKTGIIPMFPAGEFYVAYGVNHAATQKATYSSVGVYALQHIVGVAAATSAKWGGSAADYVPADPNAAKLYAWTLSRDCTNDPHCLAVAAGSCPTGIDSGQLGFFAFRAYLEPTTSTAPAPSTLQIDHILRFHP